MINRQMTLNSENQINTRLDWLKWLAVIALLIAGLVANYHYSYQPWPLRLLGWIFLMSVVLAIVLQTFQGQQIMAFARDSRMELRKVVWPTRQETVRMTLVVAGMVVFLALFLWVVDISLMWLIGWLTGQRG